MTLPQQNTASARLTSFYYLMCQLDRVQYQEQTVCNHNLVTANGTAPLEFTKQVLKMIKFKNSE